MTLATASTLIIGALIVEALVETLKLMYDRGTKKWNIDVLVSLIVGVAVCVLADIDIFKLAGIPLIVPFAGGALTGILASRGSNVIHELWRLIEGMRLR